MQGNKTRAREQKTCKGTKHVQENRKVQGNKICAKGTENVKMKIVKATHGSKVSSVAYHGIELLGLPCMALYGLVWPCMALYGLLWPFMALYGLA